MAFNLTIFEVLGALLFLIVVLILVADSLKGKTGSKFNGNFNRNISRFTGNNNSKFGNIINGPNTLTLLDASIKNGPDITFNYTTPPQYLSVPVRGDTSYTSNQPIVTSGGFQGFYPKPLILMIDAGSTAPPATVTDSTTTPLKPTAGFLLNSSATTTNLINLKELFGISPDHPMTFTAASSNTPNLVDQAVGYTITGHIANINTPLIIGHYYYIALGLMSTVPPLDTSASNTYYSSPTITGRYGAFVYKNVLFTGTSLVEVDPSGVINYDTLNFGTLYV